MADSRKGTVTITKTSVFSVDLTNLPNLNLDELIKGIQEPSEQRKSPKKRRQTKQVEVEKSPLKKKKQKTKMQVLSVCLDDELEIALRNPEVRFRNKQTLPQSMELEQKPRLQPQVNNTLDPSVDTSDNQLSFQTLQGILPSFQNIEVSEEQIKRNRRNCTLFKWRVLAHIRKAFNIQERNPGDFNRACGIAIGSELGVKDPEDWERLWRDRKEFLSIANLHPLQHIIDNFKKYLS
jgi:hypothetical protein